MTANVTREVAFALSNLQGLCKTFEVDVEGLCASSFQSLRPHEFYESIRTAAKCADALSHFQAAGSHEVTAYEDRVAEAEEAFSQQGIELIDSSIEKIASIRQEVLHYSDVAKYVYVEISTIDDIDPRKFLEISTIDDIDPRKFLYSEAEAEKRSNNTSYREALANLKKSKARDLSDRKVNYPRRTIFVGISSAIAFWILLESFLGGFYLGAVCSAFVVFFYFMKRRDVERMIQVLVIAAVEECDVVRMKMRKAIMNASAERDKEITDARSNSDSALVHIEREFSSFDARLCQCLDKLRSLIDTWMTENAHVTSMLDTSRVENLDEKERSQSCAQLIRVGTASIGGLETATHDIELEQVRRHQAADQGQEVAQEVLQALEPGG